MSDYLTCLSSLLDADDADDTKTLSVDSVVQSCSRSSSAAETETDAVMFNCSDDLDSITAASASLLDLVTRRGSVSRSLEGLADSAPSTERSASDLHRCFTDSSCTRRSLGGPLLGGPLLGALRGTRGGIIGGGGEGGLSRGGGQGAV